VLPIYEACLPDPFSNRTETLHAIEPPPRSNKQEIPNPFSQKRGRKPGPKGPSKELINAIVETKRRNPTWGCPRITQQVGLGISLDKEFVRCVFFSLSDEKLIFEFWMWLKSRLCYMSPCLIPLSNGTIRREYSDRIMFWTCSDLENKLLGFLNYYNGHRTHASLEGRSPNQDPSSIQPFADFHSYQWQSHCNGLYQTPIAA
jgi:hypothetical protein